MKTKMIYLLITLLGWVNIVKSSECKFVGLYKKQHMFYYYPKYKVYYCKENKKWYYPNGCTWIISKKVPQHISLFNVLFTEKEKVICSTSIPFSHYNRSFKKPETVVMSRAPKPKIKWHTYYQSKQPSTIKVNVNYRN